MNTSLKFKQYIKASPKLIYQAFTNSSRLREWMSDGATTEVKPGGRFFLWWNSGYYTTGEFTELNPEEHLAFTWRGRGEPGSTQVSVQITPAEEGAQLTLEHSGLGSGSEWDTVRPEFQKGWQDGLENLVSCLETGADLRITRRPMMGIGLNDFNAEIATRLGVPVSEGIRLDNLVDGMGAQAAGLQKDDVLVELAGHPLTDYNSLFIAISGRKAGDVLNLVFYRGPQKHSVEMTLSARPIPEVPATFEELADLIRKSYAENITLLENTLRGVNDAEASFVPTPGEWSAMHTLAHLLQSEVGWQNQIGEMVGGHEGFYDDYGGNLLARVEATTLVYPTLAEMVAAYKLATQETIFLIERLPEEFLARKATYWRMATGAQQSSFHIQPHISQIAAAVEAARK